VNSPKHPQTDKEAAEGHCDRFLMQEPWPDMTAGFIYQKAFLAGCAHTRSEANLINSETLEACKTVRDQAQHHKDCTLRGCSDYCAMPMVRAAIAKAGG
jgi:hypothetical protein